MIRSMTTIYKIALATGVETEYVLKHWNLIAPTVDKYGLTTSLNMITSLAKTTGASTQYIISHWDLVAPLIDKYGYKKSAEIIMKLLPAAAPDHPVCTKKLPASSQATNGPIAEALQ